MKEKTIGEHIDSIMMNGGCYGSVQNEGSPYGEGKTREKLKDLFKRSLSVEQAYIQGLITIFSKA